MSSQDKKEQVLHITEPKEMHFIVKQRDLATVTEKNGKGVGKVRERNAAFVKVLKLHGFKTKLS